jgi:hypothetical protein
MRVRDGELEKILRLLVTELQARGQLPLEEGFIDASFTGRKKGARSWPYQARQRHEDSRGLHWSQSSSRRRGTHGIRAYYGLTAA